MIKGSARGNPSPGAEALTIHELIPWAPDLVPLLRRMGVQVDGNENMALAFLCEESGIEPGDVFEALSSASSKEDTATIDVESLMADLES